MSSPMTKMTMTKPSEDYCSFKSERQDFVTSQVSYRVTMVGITPTPTTSAVRNRVIVPVFVGPGIETLGIHLGAVDSGWIEVKDVLVASPIFDKVLIGDWLERINYTHVRGLKLDQVKEILQEYKGKNATYTLYFLRKEHDVDEEIVASTAAVSKLATHPRGADDPELITPPTKRLKDTPAGAQVASLTSAARTSTVAETPQNASSLPAASSAAVAANSPQAASVHVSATELREILEDATKNSRHRPVVKETLARAYELHISTQMMKNMLDKQENKAACLVEHVEETIHRMEKESQEILAIPERLFNVQEMRLLQFIKYKVETGESSVKRCTGDSPVVVILNKWFQNQRLRRKNFEAGNKDELKLAGIEILRYDIAILDRLDFSWDSGEKKKSFDDYFAEISAFKQENGHVRVPRLLPGSNLGEWVQRMRREYDDFTQGLHAPSLNAERIDMLNELGMVWKIRYGRPRKGDARFRLRRKGDKKEQQRDVSVETPAAGRANCPNGGDEEPHVESATGSNNRKLVVESVEEAPQKEIQAPDSSIGVSHHDESDLEAKVKGVADL